MKETSPKVSIVIPTYNEEETIASCLSSLQEQIYKSYEIIVIDDGSDDKTISIVEGFPVKLIKQVHQGPAVARNRGADVAQGEILVFVDADMTFSPNFIEELVRPIEKGEASGVFSKEEYISNWNNVWSRCWNYNQNWPKQKMIPDDFPDEGNDFRAILKKEFLRVGGFDDVGYTDVWSLFKKLGYRPKAVKGAKYYHSNPSNLGEVFIQSKWVAKREYKFGLLGKIFALIRLSLPFSVVVGVAKSIKYNEMKFFIFKIVYDFGGFLGIVESIIGGKLYK